MLTVHKSLALKAAQKLGKAWDYTAPYSTSVDSTLTFIPQVFYYDGTVQCFTGDHLIVAIPSLLLVVLVVFILPTSIIVISFKRFKV